MLNENKVILAIALDAKLSPKQKKALIETYLVLIDEMSAETKEYIDHVRTAIAKPNDDRRPQDV